MGQYGCATADKPVQKPAVSEYVVKQEVQVDAVPQYQQVEAATPLEHGQDVSAAVLVSETGTQQSKKRHDKGMNGKSVSVQEHELLNFCDISIRIYSNSNAFDATGLRAKGAHAGHLRAVPAGQILPECSSA
jgi:hypothetical protein